RVARGVVAQCDLLGGVAGAEDYVLFVRAQVAVLDGFAVDFYNLSTNGPPQPVAPFVPVSRPDEQDSVSQSVLRTPRTPRVSAVIPSSVVAFADPPAAVASSSRLDPPTTPLRSVNARGAYINLQDEEEEDVEAQEQEEKATPNDDGGPARRQKHVEATAINAINNSNLQLGAG
ncbi:hypothetical protein CspeluHIS016_0600010, partial [Cutaneotrichosporon spelunceum]